MSSMFNSSDLISRRWPLVMAGVIKYPAVAPLSKRCDRSLADASEVFSPPGSKVVPVTWLVQ